MYTKQEIFNEISNILIKDFDCKPEIVKPDAKLVEDLDLDSIDAVDLVVRLQKIINVRVKPEDFKQISTLQDVVDAIEKIINSAN
ncbi:MAG: acyl carrier protein [Alphaproteobacteria bacterium]|jgi:acyl carrier protein|nr:acyl carrier protein [Alphaproteobacteria bacterium]